MGPSYYDMEKLMRIVYDKKLSSSMEKIEIGRHKALECVPSSERVPRPMRPSSATAK